jgi:two-component system chemotaxis response regulator CheB
LVVDDSPSVRNLLTEFLKLTGAVTVIGTAVDGSDAIQKIADLHPDLVLMDLEMPVMNGIEATRLIKRMEQPPRVIIVSLATPSVARVAMLMGADGFCDKSHLPESLMHQIKTVFPGVQFRQDRQAGSAPGTR